MQFLPDNPDHLSTPFRARLGSAGFQAPQPSLDGFEPRVFLQPARDGFLDHQLTFHLLSADRKSRADPVRHIEARLVAPSGNYSATLDGETLQLFSARGGVLRPVSASSKPGEACPMPLAWSLQDQIACVADVHNDADPGSHGEVRFFDLKAGSELLDAVDARRLSARTTSASTTSLRVPLCGRATATASAKPRPPHANFLPSGRWFAFTRAIGDSAYLYWADLEAEPC